MTYRFYAFEKGSTSGTTNDSHIEIFEAVRTSGLAKGKKFAANISQLRSDYVHLQKVLDCNFCVAKRFQYESPGFCCGKESKHFQTYIRAYNNLFAFTSLGVNYDRDLAKRNCVIQLMNMLKDNPCSMFLRSLASTPNLQNFQIALKCDAGLDQRVYNLPTTTEIAAI
ncbi:hypothetical protein H5410_057560 [Solanum commersonii]|uniref:Uncharacterized protein n=1 Tax=Solanum commersonii TaxID=4109 RepID=A0A9J5WPD0_SOLCO|nr:hypothetical protein H5410_057560 [Solanum commersonii]